ncbi:MAG: hypothetical protein IKZ18_02855 [Bacteroidaceae bacterium]|jgi:hypothetical protein|nr:hypothetical protein [Bacteroidaceae bacterium]
MKYTTIKRFLLGALLVFAATMVHGQILDGTVQSARYRISLPLTFNFDDGSINSSPYLSYKHDIASWLKGAAFAQYNIKQEAFVPQLWFEFSAAKRYYLLSRSIFNTRTGKYSHGLAATVKLPSHLSIDATWDNMFQQAGTTHLDRFQVVGGYINKRFIANAGYSMLYKKGIVANLRIIFSRYYFLQMKYDGGQNCYVLTSYINL